MTDDQRKELARDRMKASQPEMVTVPRELLNDIVVWAEASSQGFRLAGTIEALRKAAGIDQ